MEKITSTLYCLWIHTKEQYLQVLWITINVPALPWSACRLRRILSKFLLLRLQTNARILLCDVLKPSAMEIDCHMPSIWKEIQLKSPTTKFLLINNDHIFKLDRSVLSKYKVLSPCFKRSYLQIRRTKFYKNLTANLWIFYCSNVSLWYCWREPFRKFCKIYQKTFIFFQVFQFV